MEEQILFPSYIVLDIPSPMAEEIRRLRSRFDAVRASLPAEITLTGSCGVGLIRQGQTIRSVVEEMQKIASRFPPFATAFDHVERFQNTDIYFLTVRDPGYFIELNRAFAESAIEFEPNHYPYKPHCTLKLRSKPTEQELFDLFFLNAPRGEFILDTLSLYGMHDMNSCELLAKVELQKKPPPAFSDAIH